MFCKVCQNFMDITNNITIPEQEKPQTGGNEVISSSSTDFDLDNSDSISDLVNGLKKLSRSSNDQDDNKDKDNSDNTDSTESTESTDNTSTNESNIDISELNKNPGFAQLSNDQKNLVINKMNEKKRLDQILKPVENVVNKENYFLCRTCGYFETIPDKMFIFSRGDEKKDDIYNFNFIQYKNDPTLPVTKKYVCINDKCSTQKDPALKKAVFYRQKGSYSVRYICTICDSFWNTFVEK